MESNPTRQWFVYDKEREQGPFNEAELSQKIKAKEFGFEAYVYTEGMSDWALIKDTPVLLENSENQVPKQENSTTANTNLESRSQNDAKQETQSIKETEKTEVAVERPQSVVSSKTSPANKKPKLLILKISIASLAVAALFFAFYDNRNVIQAPATNADDVDSLSGDDEAQKTSPKEKGDWEKLRAFRLESTAQGPSFMLNSDKFDGDFPILHGALSPLLPYDTIKAALFPDSTKTIMPVPFVKLFKVAVHDGFFVVGPLQHKAMNLSPGRYKLLLAFENNFLGEASFEIGHWPTQARLLEIEKKLFSERRELAQNEKESLESKGQEMTQALEQIKNIDSQMEKAPKTKAVWSEKADNWESTLSKASLDQEKILAGPMFYPVLQQTLFQLLQDLSSLAGAYKDKHLGLNKKAVSQKNISQLVLRIQNNQAEFKKSLQSSTIENEALSIQIDKDIVKKQLLETW